MYIIKEYLEGRGSPKRISQEIGLTVRQVSSLANYNKVARSYRKWNDEDLAVLEEERKAGGYYIVRTAKRLRRTAKQVREKVAALSRQRKRNISLV